MSCRDPTEIELEAHTNVAWHEGIDTSFTVGTPGETETAFSTTETREPWGADGFVGSLVVVPGSSKEAPLAVKVVMGVTRDPHDCSIAQPDGCIFARRTLSYVPHRALQLPLELYARCVGVPCDASTTCNFLGECVPAAVDPSSCDSPNGCSAPGDQPPQDGGTTPPPGSGDASSDASVDAPSDGPTTMFDGGDGGAMGSVGCPPSGTCAAGLCCVDTSPASGPTGTCMGVAGYCPVQYGPIFAVECDGPEDCTSDAPICCVSNGKLASCQKAGCGPVLCHHDGDCPNPTQCGGVFAKFYSSCN
ncbi:MAG TPA: hypothetical protein VIF62_29590 [Labilithrix sp.]